MTRVKSATKLGKGRRKGGRNRIVSPIASQKPLSLMDWDLMASGETYGQSVGQKCLEMGRFKDLGLTDMEFMQILGEEME